MYIYGELKLNWTRLLMPRPHNQLHALPPQPPQPSHSVSLSLSLALALQIERFPVRQLKCVLGAKKVQIAKSKILYFILHKYKDKIQIHISVYIQTTKQVVHILFFSLSFCTAQLTLIIFICYLFIIIILGNEFH